MKIINVKKLIVSTLIFLFASFTTPAIGDEPLTYIPLPTKIEQQVVKTDIRLGVPQIATIEKHMRYTAQPIRAEIDYNDLLSKPFVPHESASVSFADANFLVSSVAYAWQGAKLDTTQKALLGDFDLALNLSQTGSKIVTTPTSDAKLLLMSGWDFRGSLPSFYFYSVLFIGAYLAFTGIKKLHTKKTPITLHTKGWPVTMPHASRIIQILAMHEAKIDGLIVAKKEKSLWQFAENQVRRAKGATLKTLFRALTGA